jgi:hypothetical protein
MVYLIQNVQYLTFSLGGQTGAKADLAPAHDGIGQQQSAVPVRGPRKSQWPCSHGCRYAKTLAQSSEGCGTASRARAELPPARGAAVTNQLCKVVAGGGEGDQGAGMVCGVVILHKARSSAPQLALQSRPCRLHPRLQGRPSHLHH